MSATDVYRHGTQHVIMIIVYTGGGKGKTTAALGLALRATGYDKKIRMIQFIKGSWHYGEMSSSSRLSPEFEIVAVGKGFVGIMDDVSTPQQHIDTARQAVSLARKSVADDTLDIIILDEVNYAIHLDLISEDDILGVLDACHADMDVVLTGNYATDKIIQVADLVTEMRSIKHPFQKGIRAKQGIDF